MLRRALDDRVAGHLQMLPKGRVLLVDDDVRDLEYHFRLLEGCGQEVLSCTTYAHGAGLVECVTLDLIMVSQGGPAFDGRVVLERAVETDWTLPVIVLASPVDMACYLEAMRLGAIDYMEKPVSATEMRRILKTYVLVRTPS